MRITIICVGKIKEKFYSQAVEEYLKRLTRYCKPFVIEVADEKTPDRCPDAICEQIKAKEGDRILAALKGDEYVISLAIEGRKLNSEQLAAKIEQSGISGISHIAFIIGGSLGLDRRVTDRSNMLLSFSDMTFPHQLMRVILLEQIYRSYRIISGEPYHK